MCFFSNTQQEDEFAPRGHLARKRTDSWAMIRGKTIDLKSWSVTTEKKIDEIFREKNKDCVPEWLDGF